MVGVMQTFVGLEDVFNTSSSRRMFGGNVHVLTDQYQENISPKSSTLVMDKGRPFSLTLILIVSPEIKKLLI